VVSIAKHAHATYHELRKSDLEKELNMVRTTDCYENNRSVVSMWAGVAQTTLSSER
jgi:hypothetical protein